ncbi:Ras guanine nucleotide exchange factor bud5 [Sporothrix curviconia]|uniref:Ras guanine nucleotide exchange factor bud5 n=1 Tax=Sporothrix curviconia TaxID=1260050 RepID=A0ABP0BKM7_9PEZI
MAMLSSHPMRASLSVAPLSFHKSSHSTATSDDDAYLSVYPQHTASSTSSTTTLSTSSGKVYTSSPNSQMTPPATPNGSNESLPHGDSQRQESQTQPQSSLAASTTSSAQSYTQDYSQEHIQDYAQDYAHNQNYINSAPSPPDPPPVFHNFLRAYYAFHPSYSPADSTVTLPMNEGDVILVHSIHTNGWADGTLLASGARGWLPTNYCDAYDPEEMRNLLNALLNFWDLMRSTTVNDSEIFGNQEFMKGIIAGVRYLLEHTHCLTRESALVQRHDGLRRGRKSLLSELSSLVKSAKRLQDHQRVPNPAENANDIIDEMILKAFKIVTKAVRFFDVLEDDRRQSSPAVAVMATVFEENSVPPTPPHDAVHFDGQTENYVADDVNHVKSNGSNDANDVNNANDNTVTLSSSAPSGLALPAASSAMMAASTGAGPVNKRLSTIAASYHNRLSQASPLVSHRLSSSSISHRVSLAGPSSLSEPLNLVSNRLSDRHDTFLSYLGSFIGRLHLQSQLRPHLALAIKQSATSGGQLLVVVDVVSAHNSLSRDILLKSRLAMCDRIVDLVCLARDILTNPLPEVEDVIMPQDNGRLLTAATDCVKATGECVAKTKWVIERIGDFEYEFDDATLAFDLDLSVLDAAVAENRASGSSLNAAALPVEDDERPQTAGGSASVADSVVSSSVSEAPASVATTTSQATFSTSFTSQHNASLSIDATTATSTSTSTTTTTATASTAPSVNSSPSKRTARSNPSIDKPLPEVPQVTSPIAEEHRFSLHRRSLSIVRPPSFSADDSSNMSSSNSAAAASSDVFIRPTLPPLRRISTLLPNDDFSPVEPINSNDGDFTSSFRSESLTALSSGTTSTYASRDSESSLVSQTSTRATTPEMANGPKNQPSLSDLSMTGSGTLLEDGEEDVESKLLERTFAHELMYNKEGQVTGGSLPALVERLTTHESTPDAMFVSTFYLTFRLFCTPIKLTEALIDRFEYVGESPHMAGPVRLRVYNAFKGWLESHWRDETDCEALAFIVPFAEHRLGLVLPSAGRRLLELAQRVSSTDVTLVPRLVSSMGKTNTSISQYVPLDTPLPPTIMSKSLQHSLANWKMGGSAPIIMDFDPLEMARQITMRQMTIFCSIMPEELLGSQWMKKGGLDSPNVKAMTALSTDLSNLVADTILQYTEVKKRAGVIKQWIKVAHQCYELHNYDALMAIICSLNSSTITRLRRTWDAISPKRREMLKVLQAVVEPSQNNKVLRGRLHDHVPPCLPFLGMYLTDLTFVDIGNPATKQLPGHDASDGAALGSGSSGLTVVNFDKHTRTAKIIGELQRFQIPYRLTEVPDIQDWIANQITRVRELETPGNNMQVSYYRKSLLLEPRENQTLKSVVDAGTSAAAPAAPAAKETSSSRTDLFAWMRGGNANNHNHANAGTATNVI